MLESSAGRRFVKLTQEGLERISEELARKHWSTRALAEKAEISPRTVRRVLNGEKFSDITQEKLSKALDISLEDYVSIVSMQMQLPIGGGVSLNTFNTVAQELSEAETEDVQAIASAQLKILDSYHREILIQAKNSFKWALITSATGFFFFLTSVVFVIYKQPKNQALIPLVSGAVIELIAAVNFYLYGQATQQLSSFHRKLDQSQRFL